MDQEFDEEDYDGILEYFMSRRKEVPEPLTEEDVQLMVAYFAKSKFGYLEVDTEKYHLGPDEEGYIIIANMCPEDNNKDKGYYFLAKNPFFKQKRKNKYKLDFITAFDEDEYVDPETHQIGYAMNLHEVMKLLCTHWISYSYKNP